MLLVIDRDASLFLLGRMVVPIGRGRHDSADHGVEGLEQPQGMKHQWACCQIAAASKRQASPLAGSAMSDFSVSDTKSFNPSTVAR